MATTHDMARGQEAGEERACPACSEHYWLPLDGDPTRRCPHCGASAEGAKRYEVKLSPRGFDVRCVDGEQAVYCSHSKAAARLVSDALNAGSIAAKDAVRLPQSVRGVKEAI